MNTRLIAGAVQNVVKARKKNLIPVSANPDSTDFLGLNKTINDYLESSLSPEEKWRLTRKKRPNLNSTVAPSGNKILSRYGGTIKG